MAHQKTESQGASQAHHDVIRSDSSSFTQRPHRPPFGPQSPRLLPSGYDSLRKYYQYSKERFPLGQFIPLSVIFALSASFGTQTYIYGKLGNFRTIFVTAAALFLFFLRLRLFDEFKDAEHDAMHYPSRPVPRGLIKLQELRTVIWFLIAGELGISALGGRVSSFLFLASLLYSLLMWKEFFVRTWLREHFTLYVVSHELLVFPLFFYLYSLNGLTLEKTTHSYFWLLTLFLGAQLFLLEVTRKIRPKEMEQASRDTYTAQYGVRITTALVLAIASMVLAFELVIEKRLFGSIPFLSYVPMPLAVWFLIAMLRFVWQSSEEHARQAFHASIWLVFVMTLSFTFTLI